MTYVQCDERERDAGRGGVEAHRCMAWERERAREINREIDRKI